MTLAKGVDNVAKINGRAKVAHTLPFLAGFVLLGACLLLSALPNHALAACGGLPASEGTVTLPISVPSGGSYRVWVRELAPSSNASSFYIQIADAGACQISMGGAPMTANTWNWVDYQNGIVNSLVSVKLSAGTHQIELAGKLTGVELDKVLLLSDTTCVPVAFGTNCTQASVGSTSSSSALSIPISELTASAPYTVSGDINIISAEKSGDIKSIQYFVDGKEVPSGHINTLDLANGRHSVAIKTMYANGKTTVEASAIYVDNPYSLERSVVAAAQAHSLLLILLAIVILAGSTAWLAIHFGLAERMKPKLVAIWTRRSPPVIAYLSRYRPLLNPILGVGENRAQLTTVPTDDLLVSKGQSKSGPQH